MTDQTLSAALEREHQQVDAGIGAFLARLAGGTVDADGLNTTLTALRRHIYLEEEILFPPLRQGARMVSIFGMIRGHGEIWHTMDTLASLSMPLSLSATGGGEHDALREACRQLLTLLEAHNKVEEAVIYSAADIDLEPAKATELADFMKTGKRPDGWVCEKAR